MIELTEFTEQAHAFIGAHHPRRDSGTGAETGQYAVIPEKPAEVERVELAAHLHWRRTCFDAGFGWVDGPTEYGGGGLTAAHAAAFREVERQYAVPDEAYTRFSVAILCPTMATHATKELKDELLAPLRRTDLVACQLFSEPDAGSHMSATRTTARQEGDEWIVNGQKIWTSSAHYSHVGLLLARTTPGSRGTSGLSTFLIDLDQPGIEIRPIRQLTGGASFSEVFLTDARVPDWRRIGGVGEGWAVISATMRHERSAIGTDGAIDLTLVDQLVGMARTLGRWEDPAIQEGVVEAFVRARSGQLLTERYARTGERQGAPGPEMSLSKVLLTDNFQRISIIAQDLLGEDFTGDGGEEDRFVWNQLALTIPGLRIGGGTDEIMRDIVANRVLNLPSAAAK